MVFSNLSPYTLDMEIAKQPIYNTGQEKHFNVCHSFDVVAPANEESKSSSHGGWELIYTPNLTHFTTQKMDIRGKCHLSSPANFLFYNSLEQHTEQFSLYSPSRSMALVFDQAYLTEWLCDIGVDPHEVVFDNVSFDLTKHFQDQLNILFSHRKNECSSVLSFDCMASSILLELVVKHQNSASKKIKHEIAKGKYPSNIARAKKNIAQNVTNPDFSLDELAKLSGVSKFHLVRTFKSQVGITPIQYLNQIRIEIAMVRLKDKRTKVSELAIELGYQSFSAFTKAFRKQVMLPPRQFQKMQQS